jgi:WD40-like Beta Propeller Repeat
MHRFWRCFAASCLLGFLAPEALVIAAELELLSFAPVEPHALGATTTLPVAMSPDGRFVLLSTKAPNLIAGVVDRNGCNDLIVVDRQTGERRLLSHEPGQPNVARSQGATVAANRPGLLSADGRVGLFRNASDVWCSFGGEVWYVSDLTDGSVVALADLVTVPGLPAPASLLPKALSADGRRILLEYKNHVVIHDRTAGSTLLVSHTAGDPATPANGTAEAIALTPDGRFALFTSVATDLIAGFVDAGGTAPDLYLFDASTGTTTLVSRVAGAAATGGGASATRAFVTPDGTTVVFNSSARNLIPGQIDTPGSSDAFRFVVATATTALISHHPADPARAVGGGVAGVSSDGRFTVFGAATLAATGGTDGNGSLADVFLHDRQSDASILVSQAAGAPNHGANQESGAHTVSTDGRYVLFASNATNLLPGAPLATSTSNLFRFDRTTGVVELVNHLPGQSVPATGGSFGLVFVDAGVGVVAIANGWPDLAAPLADGNNLWDTFVFDLAADEVETLSTAAFPVRTTANLESDFPVISADGKVVGYSTESMEMVPGYGFLTSPPVAVVFDTTSNQTELVTFAAGRPDL